MKRVAVISAILEEPETSQFKFNDIIAAYKHLIRGRMGLPLIDQDVSVICITVIGEVNEINSLTGKLGKLANVQVKTSISKKEFL
ncbi:iron-only hydrogenase system regulator [Vallitalea pronyensis]|uniref:Iron-only hydrogenase system regulator n=1 Tax=Vallitalea pronyensis TaxID=1348613 RepID=A0A8J8MGB2_9FIRM|nr:TM1266 family iron-only hydrogenase system putative regulator [Vallitalea pronyensis]QUI21049.1 iron-only hydrogenase system regulator [Vallitalea pronyensis]